MLRSAFVASLATVPTRHILLAAASVEVGERWGNVVGTVDPYGYLIGAYDAAHHIKEVAMAVATSYVLIETRDPFESTEVDGLFELAGRLGATADVSVYLVENGVMPLRSASAAAPGIAKLAERVTVLADDFSLRQRAIATTDLASGVTPVSIDCLVELITTTGCKAMWH
jgi:hypothetical protein